MAPFDGAAASAISWHHLMQPLPLMDVTMVVDVLTLKRCLWEGLLFSSLMVASWQLVSTIWLRGNYLSCTAGERA